MKIVWIGPYCPVPGHSGADLRSYFLMRELSRRGVSLEGWFLDSHGDDCHRFFDDLTITPRSRLRRWLRAGWERLRGTPFSYGRFRAPGLEAALPSGRILYVDHLHMSVNCPSSHRGPVWLDNHNLEHRLWEEYVRTIGPWWGPLVRPEVARVKTFELTTMAAMDGVGLPSASVGSELPEAIRATIHEIPNGVPEAWLEDGQKRLNEVPSIPTRYGFIGGFGWPPNRHGVNRFLNHVWEDHRQTHPDDRLLLAGQNPPSDWSARPGVRTLGYVEDSESFFDRIDVLVVPMEMGAGTRLKILESAARGVPFLTTEKGVEGIQFPDLRTVGTISDMGTVMQFSKQDVEALDRQRRSCYRIIRRRYRWETVGETLYETLRNL